MADPLQLDANDSDNQKPSRSRAARRAAHAVGGGRSAIAEHADETHLSDYLKVMYRRRWPAATACLLVVLAVLLYTVTATPIYKARVQLLIESDNPNVVSFKEVIQQDKATNDYYQTQYRILQSRSLARRTLDRMNAWDTFDSTKAPKKVGIGTAVAGAIASVVHLVVPEKAKDVEPQAGETAAQSRILNTFLANLTVTPVRNSRLVEIEFASPHPNVAADVANGLAKAYIEQNLEFKFTASKDASDWLGQRLAEQRKTVDESERALQRYREQSDAVSLEERQNIVVQKLADLNAAVTRAKTERIQKEAAYAQIKAVQNDAASLDTIPAILSNQFIQQQKTELAELQRQQAQLSEKLGQRHPDMVKAKLAVQNAEARIHGEIAKVVQSLQNDYQTALSQEQSLMRALDQQKQDALALNRKGIEYGALQRDAASNRQIFESLLQRTKETGISGELKVSNIRIVDAAEVPQAPSTPDKPLNALLAILGGSISGIGLAFFFEYCDNRIKSPSEIKSHLGLPFIGMIPKMTAAEGATSPLLDKGATPNFAEALRTVRTNVLFSSTAEGGQSLVVTSSGPGEGKTVVSSNLAMALAQTGQRVLLIDADMRRPRVHQVFGERQEPGLSNVLVGDTKTADAVRATSCPTLWVLPAGHLPPNPAELLGSKRFEEFIDTLKQHFAFVVIDTPPIMAVSDSAIVAHMADGVLFVIGSEMTSRNVAKTAVESLVNANGHMIGAVLNRVDLTHNAYYYSQYYRREYGHYYINKGQKSA
jgi:polysaccharide biosynthesis transport protein